MADRMNLADYLRDTSAQPSAPNDKPSGYVSADGDCLFYHHEDVPYFADRVDGLLTLFRAMTDSHLVGFELKGISQMPTSGLHRIMVNPSETPGFEVITLLTGGYIYQYGHDDGSAVSRPQARIAAPKYAEAVRTFGRFIPTGDEQTCGSR
jgi:hypothetical protein